MKKQTARVQTMMSAEAIRGFTSLIASVQLLCAANHVRLAEQSLSVIMPGMTELAADFAARQPMGFAFTEGHRASFNVPFGHRFVIEQISLSCWAEDNRLRVQLATKSPRGYRNVALYCAPDSSERGLSCQLQSDPPVIVQGSSRGTFLFSNGEIENSATVPPHTYVQVWGCLEPAEVMQALETPEAPPPTGVSR